MSKCIYVVEDEKDMLDFFRYILTEEEYDTKCFSSGEDALKNIYIKKPDLILLDLMLPGVSGFEVCRIVKNDPELWNIPVIVISSRKEEFDIINGLSFGCDDYITKPFSEKILLAKIKSFLSKQDRSSLENIDVIKFKDLLIDQSKFEAYIKDKIIDLTPAEFKLLNFLVRNMETVHSRLQISDKIYNHGNLNGDRSIDILVARVRKKIGVYSKNIESIYGVGYWFKKEI